MQVAYRCHSRRCSVRSSGATYSRSVVHGSGHTMRRHGPHLHIRGLCCRLIQCTSCCRTDHVCMCTPSSTSIHAGRMPRSPRSSVPIHPPRSSLVHSEEPRLHLGWYRPIMALSSQPASRTYSSTTHFRIAIHASANATTMRTSNDSIAHSRMNASPVSCDQFPHSVPPSSSTCRTTTTSGCIWVLISKHLHKCF